MADSTYLKNVVEPFIVQWVSQRIGVGKAGRASCLPVGTACAGYSPLAQTGWKHCPTLLASISVYQRSKIFATLCVENEFGSAGPGRFGNRRSNLDQRQAGSAVLRYQRQSALIRGLQSFFAVKKSL